MLSEKRLDKLIDENLNKMPAEPFVWWQKTWWSRSAFLELVDACEERLRASDFKKGQRLALLMPNSPVLLAASIAVWRLGGSVVPIDPRSGYTQIVRRLIHADVFAALAYNSCKDLVSLISEEGIPCTAINLDAFDENIPGRICKPDEEDVAVIFYTSGITDEPKAVPLSHSNLISCIESCIAHLEDFAVLNDDDVFLNALPNSNVFGFLCGALMPLVLAARQAILPTFIPVKTSMEVMREAEVTIVIAVPMMISLMSSALSHGAAPQSTLKFFVTGADRLEPEMKKRAQDLFKVPVLQGYGLTEASAVVSLQPRAAADDDAKAASVGTLLSCLRAEIRDDEGAVLPIGETGSLWIKGRSVAECYYRNPELTEERFKDGWFNTGDIAKFDKEGFLYLAGRAGDVIFVGGFKVFPREVEKVLKEHPAVLDAAVAGVSRAVAGEIVKAFVVTKPGERVLSKDLIEHCKKKLSYYKVPRIIEFVSELPRSEIGEVVKRKLTRD